MAAGDIIRLRRDTAANWTSGNPVLALGEAGIETDTRKWKVGDGASAWVDLPYMVGGIYAGTAALASGSVTVSADWVTTQSVIVVTAQSAPGTAGTSIYVDPANIVAATSFQIDSDDATDARSVFWIAAEPNPDLEFVMLADGTVAIDSHVEKVLGSDQNEAWVTFDARYTAAAETWWSDAGRQYSGDVCVIKTNADGFQSDFWFEPTFVNGDFALTRNGTSQSDASPLPSADAWHTYEIHYKISDVSELYIDGSLVITTGSGDASAVRKFQFGLEFGFDGDPAQLLYFRDIKIGTTRGASDLFADDFSSGDLSNWTSTTGTMSVILDPF